MKSTYLAPIFGACLLAAATFVQATETTMIQIGDHDVPVVKGGLYDRFRSNPPLSVIAAESPDTDLSWFRGITKEALVTNSFTNIDQQGQLTTGYTTSRQLRHASSSSADDVKLTLTDGSLSRFIESLDLGRMVKYEYVPNFQAALYAPKPLASATGK